MKEANHPEIRLNADFFYQSAVGVGFDIEHFTTHRFSTVLSIETDREAVLKELGPGGSLVAEIHHRKAGGVSRLISGDGWIAAVHAESPPHATVRIATQDREMLADIAAHFEAAFPEPTPDDRLLPITFTYDSRPCSEVKVHPVEAPPWSEVERNYPPRVRGSIERLLHVSRPSDGRLVLLHGPPGTGKSWLLRTLAREWSDWADAVVVTDPEALLSNTSYLYDVVDQDFGVDRWRLVIIEDAAELLGETSRSGMHPGLSKMLNLSDGMLGEAFGIVVAITTNEPLGRIHPAVMRTGRCMANIHLDGFTREEARERLAGRTPPDGDRVMLSDIFEMEREAAQIVEEAEPQVAGAYM